MWDERFKTRTEELLALVDNIKILNDDDALDNKLITETNEQSEMFKVDIEKDKNLEVIALVKNLTKKRHLTAVTQMSHASAHFRAELSPYHQRVHSSSCCQRT